MGESDMAPRLGACVFWERWHGVSGGNGFTLVAFNKPIGAWHYLFVNDTGLTLTADGRPSSPGMGWVITHLSEARPDQSERWEWTPGPRPLRAGFVSHDSSRTWQPIFQVVYHPWQGALPPISRHNGPCHDMRQYRSLDFMVGRWEIRSASGALIARSRVDTLLDGCAIREEWEGKQRGLSLAGFDVSSGTWRRLDIADQERVTVGEGTVTEETVTWMSRADSGIVRRSTLTRLSPRHLRLLTEVSSDGGTWRGESVLTYQRVRDSTRRAD